MMYYILCHNHLLKFRISRWKLKTEQIYLVIGTKTKVCIRCYMGAGTRWTAQERTFGKPGSSADIRSTITIHRKESHRRQSRHFYESRQCYTRNEKSYECDLEGGHNLFRLRHKGEPWEYSIHSINIFLKWTKTCFWAIFYDWGCLYWMNLYTIQVYFYSWYFTIIFFTKRAASAANSIFTGSFSLSIPFT